MKHPIEIPINRFQLARLLDAKQMEIYNEIITHHLFCSNCAKLASEGIVVEEIILTSMNDICVHGTCKICRGKVTRLLEFADNKAFYSKVTDFRNTV